MVDFDVLISTPLIFKQHFLPVRIKGLAVTFLSKIVSDLQKKLFLSITCLILISSMSIQ